MALTIKTTGLENYSASGTGRVKVLVIGGPGVGKTRWSSYFPKPIYLDCEGGLASVADRQVPYVPIKSSQDMLEALTYLRVESGMPEQDRKYRTVVVDTLDAFQRKVKDEWLIAHPNEQSFRGFEAWGYLDTKMQMLLTRLLNLDMNVIVSCHYTDKTITEGSGNDAVQRQEIQLQLSGAVRDQVFNDFDLVGWMGTYYQAVGGERVEKRGLTFKATFEKPFLKDRLHVTPSWMEVKFSDEDYATLFAAVISRLDDLQPSEDVGEIPSLVGDGSPPAGVVGPLPGGALPPVDPKDVPLEQNDKVTLQRMARAMGLEFKNNTLKGELVDMIKAAQAAAPAEVAPAAESTSDSSAPAVTAPPIEEAVSEPQPMRVTEEQRREQALSRLSGGASSTTTTASTPVEAAPTPDTTPSTTSDTTSDQQVAAKEEAQVTPEDKGFIVDERGQTVNPKTGEVITATSAEAEQSVIEQLGGEVVEVKEAVAPEPSPAPAPTPTPAPVPNVPGQRVRAEHCEEPGCTNPIGPNEDFIKLGYIKWRKDYCNDHFLAHKRAA